MIKNQDLVRIVKQPEGGLVQVCGLEGFADKVDYRANTCYFAELSENGIGGRGTISLSCLKKIDTPKLRRLKQIQEDKIDMLVRQNANRSDAFAKLKQEYLARACAETDMDMGSVLKVFEIMGEFEEKWKELRLTLGLP